MLFFVINWETGSTLSFSFPRWIEFCGGVAIFGGTEDPTFEFVSSAAAFVSEAVGTGLFLISVSSVCAMLFVGSGVRAASRCVVSSISPLACLGCLQDFVEQVGAWLNQSEHIFNRFRRSRQRGDIR